MMNNKQSKTGLGFEQDSKLTYDYGSFIGNQISPIPTH